jgi:uncharacterized membrane protein
MRTLRLILLAAVLLFAVHPILRPYQVAGHSAYVDLSRAEAFHQAVRGGDLAPRWLPDFYFHYGSPIFNFYAPLAYYVIELFRMAGLDGMWALKAAYLLFWLLAALAMYLLAASMFGEDGALAAAAAYVLAPYLLVDAYVRNGIAEFACFALLPLVLLGAWRAARERGSWGVIGLAVAYAALTFTHNVTALIATPLIVLFILLVAVDWRALLSACFSLLCGLMLAAFFWLPAMVEKSEVHANDSLTGGFFQYTNHFLSPIQLFLRKWDFGASVAGPNDKMGFMFGEMMWLALLLGVVSILVLAWRKDLAAMRVRLALITASAISLLMTLSWSAAIWAHLPLISFVQFPWRFLLPATVFAVPLVATLPAHFPKRFAAFVATGLCIAAVAASFSFVRVRYVFQHATRNAFVFASPEDVRAASLVSQFVRPDRFLTIATIRRLGVTSTASQDYLPIACTKLPDREPETAAEPGGPDVRILFSDWGYVFVRAEVQATVQDNVVFNQFYFPGWRANVDDIPAPIVAESGTGRKVVTVGPGRHVIVLEFGDTPVHLLAKGVSVFGLIVLGLWVWALIRFRRVR